MNISKWRCNTRILITYVIEYNAYNGNYKYKANVRYYEHDMPFIWSIIGDT